MEFLIFCIIAIVVSEIYVWFAFVRHLGTVWKLFYWIPYASMLATIIWMSYSNITVWKIYTLTGLMIAFFAPFGAFAVSAFIGQCLGRKWKAAGRVGFTIGVILGIIVFISGVYGLTKGWRKVVVREIPVAFSNLPASFDGYRIAHISDLHIGTYRYSSETVTEIVDRINEAGPDIVLFTGDMINIVPEEFGPFISEIKRINAPDGIYSVMGNHDYCGYARFDTTEEQQEAVERLQEMEREAGMKLLLNENAVISNGTDSIAVVGVEYVGQPQFPAVGDIVKASEGLPEGIFKILMSHDPTHWHYRIKEDSRYSLTLSGHTHAMQCRIGRLSPSMFLFDEWGGLYSGNNNRLYVNTGTGGNIPFRIGAWPEIDIIELRKCD
ncbi:MAG: metallophosphoesterase [Candidatus Cryptobacteroides sp.]